MLGHLFMKGLFSFPNIQIFAFLLGLVSETRFSENSGLICCDCRETQGFRFQKAGSP